LGKEFVSVELETMAIGRLMKLFIGLEKGRNKHGTLGSINT
jgi:hypothetical protein